MLAGGSCRAWRAERPPAPDHHHLFWRHQDGPVEATLVGLGGQRRRSGEGRVDPAEVEPAARPHRDGGGAPAHRVGLADGGSKRGRAEQRQDVEVTERSQRRSSRRAAAARPPAARSAPARGPALATTARRRPRRPGAGPAGRRRPRRGRRAGPSSPRPRSSASPGTLALTQLRPGCSGCPGGRPTGRAIASGSASRATPARSRTHIRSRRACGVGVGVAVAEGAGDLVPAERQIGVISLHRYAGVARHEVDVVEHRDGQHRSPQRDQRRRRGVEERGVHLPTVDA